MPHIDGLIFAPCLFSQGTVGPGPRSHSCRWVDRMNELQ